MTSSMMDAAFAGLSEETLDRLVLVERAENAEAEKEQRKRAADLAERRADLQQLVALGLRRVRTPAKILSDWAALGDDVDANAQRCRSVFEAWLQRGGQVAELKELLGHQAALDRGRMGQQRTQLLQRAEAAEARLDGRDRRILELEREVAGLRYRAERVEAAVGGLESGRG